LSLNGIRRGFDGKPDLSVVRLAEPNQPLADGATVDAEAYDLVLMIVDGRDL
jgi:hypothetical protein